MTKHIGSYEHKSIKIDAGRGLETVSERTRVRATVASSLDGHGSSTQTFDDPDLHEDYCRVITPENSMSEEAEEICFKLLEAMKLRDKWFFQTAEYRKPANKPVSGRMKQLCAVQLLYVFRILWMLSVRVTFQDSVLLLTIHCRHQIFISILRMAFFKSSRD